MLVQVVAEMEKRLMKLSELIKKKDKQIEGLREVVHAECTERAALLAQAVRQ